MTPEGVTGALQHRREGRRGDEFKRVKGGGDEVGESGEGGADDGTGMRETQIKWERTKERKSWQLVLRGGKKNDILSVVSNTMQGGLFKRSTETYEVIDEAMSATESKSATAHMFHR